MSRVGAEVERKGMVVVNINITLPSLGHLPLKGKEFKKKVR